MTPDQAEQILKNKPKFQLHIDNTLMKTQKDKTFCAQLIGSIYNAIQENKILHAELSLLTRYGLSIKFYPYKPSMHDRELADTVLAAYHDTSNCIHIFMPNLDGQMENDFKKIMGHETVHAYKDFIHKKRYQNTHHGRLPEQDGISFASPYYPFTSEESDKISESIKTGDKRVEEFMEMLILSGEGFELSENGKSLFNKYLAVAKLHVQRTIFLLVLKETCPDLELLRQEKAAINSKKVTYVDKIPIRVRDKKLRAYFYVKRIQETEKDFEFHGCYIKNQAKSVEEHAPYSFAYEMLLRSSFIKDSDKPNYIIKEHHARIIGELSYEILRVFYPELLEYDAKDTAEAIKLISDDKTPQPTTNNVDEKEQNLNHLTSAFFSQSNNKKTATWNTHKRNLQVRYMLFASTETNKAKNLNNFLLKNGLYSYLGDTPNGEKAVSVNLSK